MRTSPRWRRCRSSFERGIMWLTLIGSPVSGSGIRQSSGYSCWRSNTAASAAAAPANAGCSVTSSTLAPSSHSSRGRARSPLRNSSPVRAAIALSAAAVRRATTRPGTSTGGGTSSPKRW